MLHKIYFVIYQKNTNQIAQTRQFIDGEITQNDLDDLFANFCAMNAVNVNDYEMVKLSSALPNDLYFGKHIYDLSTNSVIVDPTWIDPPRVETASIPVSGT
jgi:hypothetical protein